MNAAHLEEEEMQLYAMGKVDTEQHIASHLAVCETCRVQLALYQSILNDMEKQQPPVFDFDVAALVLPQIEPVKTKTSTGVFSSVLLVAFIICITLIPLYIFRNNFVTMVSGVSAIFIYVSVPACIAAITFNAVKMYQKYMHQIKTLNLS